MYPLYVKFKLNFSLNSDLLLWKWNHATETFFLVNWVDTRDHRNSCKLWGGRLAWDKGWRTDERPQIWICYENNERQLRGRQRMSAVQYCRFYYSIATDPESSCQPVMLQYWLYSKVFSRARTLPAELIKQAINQLLHIMYLNLLLKVRL